MVPGLLLGEDRGHLDIVAGGFGQGHPAAGQGVFGGQHVGPEQLPVPGVVDADHGHALGVHVQPGPEVVLLPLDVDRGDGLSLGGVFYGGGRPVGGEHLGLGDLCRGQARRQHGPVQPQSHGMVAARSHGGHVRPSGHIALACAVVAAGHDGAVRLQTHGGAGAAGDGHDVRPPGHVALSIGVVAAGHHGAVLFKAHRVPKAGADADHVGPVVHVALTVVVEPAGHGGAVVAEGHGVPGPGSHVRHAVPLGLGQPLQSLAAHGGHMAVVLQDQGVDQTGRHLLHAHKGGEGLLGAEGLAGGIDLAARKVEHTGRTGEHLIRMGRGVGVPSVPGDPGGVARHGGVPGAGGKLIHGGGLVLLAAIFDPGHLLLLQRFYVRLRLGGAQDGQRGDALVKVGPGEYGLGRSIVQPRLDGRHPLRGILILVQGLEGGQSLLVLAGLLQNICFGISLSQSLSLGQSRLPVRQSLAQGLGPVRIPLPQQVSRVSEVVRRFRPVRFRQKQLVQLLVQGGRPLRAEGIAGQLPGSEGQDALGLGIGRSAAGCQSRGIDLLRRPINKGVDHAAQQDQQDEDGDDRQPDPCFVHIPSVFLPAPQGRHLQNLQQYAYT